MLTANQQQQLKDRLIKQTMFNVVVNKMRQQGKAGVHDNEARLRASDGTRCSLGWLVTDKFYEPRFEERPPNEVMIDILDMPPLGYQFYDDVQYAHDASANAEDWWAAFSREMRKVATKHCLDPGSLQVAA